MHRGTLCSHTMWHNVCVIADLKSKQSNYLFTDFCLYSAEHTLVDKGVIAKEAEFFQAGNNNICKSQQICRRSPAASWPSVSDRAGPLSKNLIASSGSGNFTERRRGLAFIVPITGAPHVCFSAP